MRFRVLRRRLSRIFEGRGSSAASRDTDGDWEEIGRLNPYFGVLTDPRFKTENLTEATRAEFFQSGLDAVDLEHSDHGGFHGVIVRGRKPA